MEGWTVKCRLRWSNQVFTGFYYRLKRMRLWGNDARSLERWLETIEQEAFISFHVVVGTFVQSVGSRWRNWQILKDIWPTGIIWLRRKNVAIVRRSMDIESISEDTWFRSTPASLTRIIFRREILMRLTSCEHVWCRHTHLITWWLASSIMILIRLLP